MTVRLTLIGGHALGRAVWAAVAGDEFTGAEFTGVVTGDKRLAGLAAAAGVPVLDRPSDAAGAADLGVMAHHTGFLSAEDRGAHPMGVVGYHPSLLPRHRGGDAIEWTIRMRDPVAGGSVFLVTGDVDGGPVLLQEHCHVLPGDDARSLWRRSLMPIGARLLVRAVRAAASGGLPPPIPLPAEAATWEPKIARPPLERSSADAG